ncbi:hypothetical protein NA32_09855, partial [Streptococcus hongkongensis]
RNVPKYAYIYQALQQAKLLLELRRSKPDGFHYSSAQEMYLAYEAELFQFDAAYRLFNEALLHLQGQSVEVLAILASKIERSVCQLVPLSAWTNVGWLVS